MNNNNDREEFVMALAGNKCDIDPAQKKILPSMTEELSKKFNMITAETSAKTGEGVQDLFR